MSRRPKQLSLDVRIYNVRAEGHEARVQAASPAAAKYQLYKRMRDAGYFAEGFRAFLECLPIAREIIH